MTAPRYLAALAALLCLFAQPLRAAPPVVVELFTSQGCSSCPPADALLADLAREPEVIALAFHVDYWDYIGWPDEFGDPAFTARQKAYGARMHLRAIYTPQMVIDGRTEVAGTQPMEVIRHINHALDAPAAVDITAIPEGDGVDVTLAPTVSDLGPAELSLVTVLPRSQVAIGAGENAGRVLEYVNIVRAVQLLARWDGAETETMHISLPEGDTGAVLLVQRPGQGPILGAAQLR